VNLSRAGVEGGRDVVRNPSRRHQHDVEADVADAVAACCASQASAAAMIRPRWRSLTDQAASSSRSRALTSTKTSRLRRRAMMSISPTGLRQRRARMRKPLAMRKAAARLSAEIPVRNAI
jgi:hypothetical protein